MEISGVGLAHTGRSRIELKEKDHSSLVCEMGVIRGIFTSWDY